MTILPVRTENDDTSTVQVSQSTSLLGTYLLEGDWQEALDHLGTPEGQQDVIGKSDPLGLLCTETCPCPYDKPPPSKTSALFAGLFVRAPFDVIAAIQKLAPLQTELDDLIYVLSVIPSEEQQRKQRTSCRSRAWTEAEYLEILHLLLRHAMYHWCTDGSSMLLVPSPNWILPTSSFSLTPLAMAAYNPDVTAQILRLLCTLEPRAREKECKLLGVRTLPFIIAASSPLPPETNSMFRKMRENRWEKVESLIVGKEWYVRELQRCDVWTNSSSLPKPTIQEVTWACEEARKRKEWELVRELLKRQQMEPPVVQAMVEYEPIHDERDVLTQKDAITAVPSEQFSSLFTHVHAALQEHDRKVQSNLLRKQKRGARNDWVHKKMGFVMYQVDALIDMTTAVLPSSWSRSLGSDEDAVPGLVARMS